MKSLHPPWGRGLFGGIIIAALSVTACPETEPEMHIVDLTQGPQDLPELRECPKEWTFRTEAWATRSAAGLEEMPYVPTGTLSGPGRIQNVPEFHDCQRFAVMDANGNPVTYSGMFAAFAVFDSSLLSHHKSRMSRLQALASADSARRQQEPRLSNARDTAALHAELREQFQGFTGLEVVPAVQIVAWSDYARLGIKRGFNCLYLHPDPDGSGWSSQMIHSGMEEKDCSRAADRESLVGLGAATALEVEQLTDASLRSESEYPLAARWDWNGRDYYLGVRCGAAWCAIHGTGIQTSKSYADGPGPFGDIPQGSRRHRIKGWYDQQLLARAAAGSEAGPQPTRLLGTLIPYENLGSLNSPQDFAEWVPVARVALWAPSEETTNPYLEKLNLAITPTTDRRGPLNRIFLRHGLGDSVLPQGVQVPSCGDGMWWARIQRASKTKDRTDRYLCVKKCDVPEIEIPGIVRWRWHPKDETMWIRCARGCCEVILPD